MKYLYCRPKGGLNDAFCQIEAAIRFSQQTSRHLVIETSDCGILVPFDTVFRFNQDNLSVTIAKDGRVPSEWDSMTVYPIGLSGKLHEYFQTPRSSRKTMIRGLGRALDLPPADVDSEIVVHHQGGGGRKSLDLLNRITVTEETSRWINRQLDSLPKKYSAVHVRATDHTTNYVSLFQRIKRRERTRPLLVCSDNQEVLSFAKEFFPPGQVLVFDGTAAGEAGKPTHIPENYGDDSAKLAVVQEALRDLAALSGARVLYTSFVERNKNFPMLAFSGFTEIASHLTVNPKIRQRFFGIEGHTPAGLSTILAPAKLRFLYVLQRYRRR